MSYQDFFRQSAADDREQLGHGSTPSTYDALHSAIAQQQHFVSHYVQNAQAIYNPGRENSGDLRPPTGSSTRGDEARNGSNNMSPRTRAHQQQWREALGGGQEQSNSLGPVHDASSTRVGIGVGASRTGPPGAQETTGTRSVERAVSSRSSTPSVAPPPMADGVRQQKGAGAWLAEDERESTGIQQEHHLQSAPVPATSQTSAAAAPMEYTYENQHLHQVPPTILRHPVVFSPTVPDDPQYHDPGRAIPRAAKVPVGSQASYSNELDEQYRMDHDQQEIAAAAAAARSTTSNYADAASPFWVQQHLRQQRRAVESSPLEQLSHRHSIDRDEAPPNRVNGSQIARVPASVASSTRGEPIRKLQGLNISPAVRRAAPQSPAASRRTPSAATSIVASSHAGSRSGHVLSASAIRSSLHDATTRMVALNQTLLQLTETHRMLSEQSDAVRSQITVAEAERHDTETQYQALCGTLKQAMEELGRQLKVKQEALSEARETNARLRQQIQQSTGQESPAPRLSNAGA